MNVIEIPYTLALQVYENNKPRMTPSYMIRYINFPNLTFNDYFIRAYDPEHENAAVSLFYIKVVKINDFIKDLDKEDIETLDKSVHTAIETHFLFQNGKSDFYLYQYVVPQITNIEGDILFDLAIFKTFANTKPPNETAMGVALSAMTMLDYVERLFKKNRKFIKKNMPTPEEKELILSNKKRYESQPIFVKDISIKYVYEPHEKTREYERHCEAWGVRGHYRHYKNGKVIFVKPFTKGKGTKKDTEYLFDFSRKFKKGEQKNEKSKS